MMKTKLFGQRRGLTIAGGLLLVAGLFACGGSGNDCGKNPTGPGCIPPVTVPPTTLPPPAVVSQGATTLAVDFALRVPFTTTQAGRLDVTADWTFVTNDVDVYLMRGNCTFDQFNAAACDVATFSVSETAKPEKVRLTGAAAGSYTLFIGNVGPTDEAVSYQVVLAPGASSASASRDSRMSLPDKMQRLRGSVELP
jgi:hypothetical protein